MADVTTQELTCADPTCGKTFRVVDYHRNRQRYCCTAHGARHRARTRRKEANPGWGTCHRCGGAAGPYSILCRTCYAKQYRADPARRSAHRRAVADYQRRNPEKRLRWVQAYRRRIGYYVPDLQDLRAAIKAIDQAVVIASLRESIRRSGERGGDDGAEW